MIGIGAAIAKVLAYTLLRWEKWPSDAKNLASNVDFSHGRVEDLTDLRKKFLRKLVNSPTLNAVAAKISDN